MAVTANASSKRKTAKLPSWACYIAPKEKTNQSDDCSYLFSEDTPFLPKKKKETTSTQPRKPSRGNDGHYSLDQDSSRRRRKRRNSSISQDNTKEDETTSEEEEGCVLQKYTEEIKSQEEWIKLRLYHLQSRRLDRLVHEFLVSSFETATTTDESSFQPTTPPTTTTMPASSSFTTNNINIKKAININAATNENETKDCCETLLNESTSNEKFKNDETISSTTVMEQGPKEPKNSETNPSSSVCANSPVVVTVAAADMEKSETASSKPTDDDDKGGTTNDGPEGTKTEMNDSELNSHRHVPDHDKETTMKDANTAKRKIACLEPTTEETRSSDMRMTPDAFYNRYQMFTTPPPATPVGEDDSSNTSFVSDRSALWTSRLVLPVTIWPQTAAPLQHTLDRQYWTQCWVTQQRHVLCDPNVAAVVWLQQGSIDHGSDYSGGNGNHLHWWPQEEMIRQLWRTRVPSVQYSRKRWSRMTLSEMLQTWARYYCIQEDGDQRCERTRNPGLVDRTKLTAENGSDPVASGGAVVGGSGGGQKTIQVIWDPQTCPIHSHFWIWLTEQRCLHGVPITVTLLEDRAQARVFQNHHSSQLSTTLPHSCAAQIHIVSAKKPAVPKSASTTTTTSANFSGWLERLVDFGLVQLDDIKKSARNGGAEDHYSLQVVLRWLLQRMQQNEDANNCYSVYDHIDGLTQEVVPILLHWKKELAIELSKIHIMDIDHATSKDFVRWQNVAQDVLWIALDCNEHARIDLIYRLKYVDLLYQAINGRHYRSICSTTTEARRQQNMEYKAQSSISLLAFRFRKFLQQLQTENPSKSRGASLWSEQNRRRILAWLLQQQKRSQEAKRIIMTNTNNNDGEYHHQSILDCIHEWVILVEYCPNFTEYQKCVETRFLLLPDHRTQTFSSRTVTQIRRETVVSLKWNQYYEMPEKLVSLLSSLQERDDPDDGEQQQQQQQQPAGKEKGVSSTAKQCQKWLVQWTTTVAPAALYQTLREQTSVSYSDWFHDFCQRIQEELSHQFQSPPLFLEVGANVLFPAFQYGVRHLRLMGLIREQQRGHEISFEKIALVFCSDE